MHSHSSRIGIFYIIGVDLYVESIPMIEGEDWGDFKTYPNGHMEYWELLTKQLKLSSCLSYDFYARGRVSYAKAQDKYMLYLDRCLVKNRQMIRLIKKELCLSNQRVELSTDEHYQCNICNPHYVTDYTNDFIHASFCLCNMELARFSTGKPYHQTHLVKGQKEA